MNRPGWDWHPPKGSLSGHWSVSVNGNWRLIFVWLDQQAAYDLWQASVAAKAHQASLTQMGALGLSLHAEPSGSPGLLR